MESGCQSQTESWEEGEGRVVPANSSGQGSRRLCPDSSCFGETQAQIRAETSEAGQLVFSMSCSPLQAVDAITLPWLDRGGH